MEKIIEYIIKIILNINYIIIVFGNLMYKNKINVAKPCSNIKYTNDVLWFKS
jgi:hypothetical protein